MYPLINIRMMKNMFLNNSDGKNTAIKQKILGFCVNDGDYSIAELSKETNTSIPTITKLVGELIEDGYLKELGKIGTSGGRRPSIYGLNPDAGYFVGVDVSKTHVSLAVSNFKGSIIDYKDDLPFCLESTEQSMYDLCAFLKKYTDSLKIETKDILAYGLNLTGRVNRETGHCFSYFLGEDMLPADILEEKLGAPVFIENDSRAMTYGEYLCGMGDNVKNMLFMNVSWGLGMGMILDGKLYYGKSGYSGEMGHFPFLDNGIICQCGKVGCLETGASGLAVHRIFMEKIKEGKASLLSEKYARGGEITLNDILEALAEEDVLAIESVEEIGSTLGRAIAGLINVFNPKLVVIGGRFSIAEEYLMLPIKSAINKYSLNIVSKDTVIKFSKLGKKAGPIGACMLSRSHLLGII